MLFKPPKSGALKDAIENQSFPSIILDILVGSKDEHFLPDVAEKLSQITKAKQSSSMMRPSPKSPKQ